MAAFMPIALAALAAFALAPAAVAEPTSWTGTISEGAMVTVLPDGTMVANPDPAADLADQIAAKGTPLQGGMMFLVKDGKVYMLNDKTGRMQHRTSGGADQGGK